MKDKHVIVVDTSGNDIGTMPVLDAHIEEGILHRAVSVLLFRKNGKTVEVLLQKRSIHKQLWPGFWANTVCTHPAAGEDRKTCAIRRLNEEMGIAVKPEVLTELHIFTYHAAWNDQWSEYETDNFFVGIWDGKITSNPKEVEEYQWIQWDELKDRIKTENVFTPWLLHMVNDKRTNEYISRV